MTPENGYTTDDVIRLFNEAFGNEGDADEWCVWGGK